MEIASLIIISSFLCYIFSYYITGKLVDYLQKKQILDQPNERSNHKTPTPRGGGIAVMICIFLFIPSTYYLYFILTEQTNSSFISSILLQEITFLSIIAASVFLAFISFIDDLKTISAKWRFLSQILITVISVTLILPQKPTFQDILPNEIDIILTIIAIIWFTNLYNFMDGIDGITGMQTVTICVGIISIGAVAQTFEIASITSTIIAISCLGFLAHNWHPARIFMGDVGSIPLGFILSCMLIIVAKEGYWAEALIISAYYLADSTYTITKRLLQGKRIWEAHSEHFYQKAVRSGRSHSNVVKTILFANILLIITAYLSSLNEAPFISLGVAAIIVLMLITNLNKTQNQDMSFLLPNKRYLIALHDIIMIGASFTIALYLRLGDEFDPTQEYIYVGTIALIAVSIPIFSLYKIFSRVWNYTSMQDLLALTKAVTLTISVFLLIMFLYNRLEGMPRSLMAINWFIMMAMLGAPRFLYRTIKEKSIHFDTSHNKIPILLAGLTNHSELFLRESVGNKKSNYKIVGILDNDKTQNGRYVHNVKIFGNISDAKKTIEKLTKNNLAPQKIILTPDRLEGESVKELLDLSQELGLTIERLPRITDFRQTEIDKLALRPVAVEDLLGRPQNTIDKEAMSNMVKDKNIFITGAGGTIGSELVRQVARFKPAKIILFEISEYNLYLIDKELDEKHPKLNKKPVIGDVREYRKVEKLLKDEDINIVFHAAALKHVPMSEMNISEAVLTNILGTKNIADACISANTETMIMISTDKAVNPTNVMGATKRVAESYIQALGNETTFEKITGNHHKTKFATIRFGNVLGSTGSVIPLFKRQLENNGPLTVTHPEITRYFMTVREAVELVLQAAVLSENDDSFESKIYVLDMGEPVFIKDLAEQIIRLAGLEPHKDIEIKYTGLRPGEKLHEELFHDSENITSTDHHSIMLAESREISLSTLNKELKKLQEKASLRNEELSLNIIKRILPEFKHTTHE